MEKVRAALKGEGFGVLSEIEINEKLKEKIGLDFSPLLDARRMSSSARVMQVES